MREKKARLKLGQQEESWSIVYCVNFLQTKKKKKKKNTSSFSSSVVVSLVILRINELLYVTYRKRTQSTLFTYNVFEETGDCLALLVAAPGFLSET